MSPGYPALACSPDGLQSLPSKCKSDKEAPGLLRGTAVSGPRPPPRPPLSWEHDLTQSQCSKCPRSTPPCPHGTSSPRGPAVLLPVGTTLFPRVQPKLLCGDVLRAELLISSFGLALYPARLFIQSLALRYAMRCQACAGSGGGGVRGDAAAGTKQTFPLRVVSMGWREDQDLCQCIRHED